jgi:hypothetical protein
MRFVVAMNSRTSSVQGGTLAQDFATGMCVVVARRGRVLAVTFTTQCPCPTVMGSGTRKENAATVRPCSIPVVSWSFTVYCEGVVNADGECCGSPTAVLDRDGSCCYTRLDACGVCNGTNVAIDVSPSLSL